MIIVYERKYQILQLNQKTGILEPNSTHYYNIIDTYLYENFILFFLTDKGLYFHILNEENGTPVKLRNSSEENTNLHMRISKRLKEKSRFYNKKLFNQKILGVFKNVIAMTDSFNNTNITRLEHPIFDIMDLIISRKFNSIANKLDNIEKKYASKIAAIFDYYFSLDNEDVIRNLIGNNNNTIDLLQIVKYIDFLKKDLINNKNPNCKHQLEKLIKNILVKSTAKADENKIAEIYEFCTENNL
jgi:hypothetical protein